MEERLLELLESVLGRGRKKAGDNYAFWSPFINHQKPKLEVNIQLNSEGLNPWHCWVSDEKGKTIRSLFIKLKVSKEVWDEHNSIFKRKYKYAEQSLKYNPNEVVELPKEYKPLWVESNSIVYKHALNYLLRRGLQLSDIIKYNIGYCTEGEYAEKIIIPSYDSNGRLNFFVGRSFYEGGESYKNPKVSKDIIGFEMFVNWDFPIVITEGVFDAIALRMNAIPLLGKSPQQLLRKTIISKKVKDIYVVLDKDAFKNALSFAEQLMNDGINTYFVELGESDPAELGFDIMYDKLKKTQPLDFKTLMMYKLGMN